MTFLASAFAVQQSQTDPHSLSAIAKLANKQAQFYGEAPNLVSQQTVGSTFVARRAGMYHASRVTANRVREVAAKLSASIARVEASSEAHGALLPKAFRAIPAPQLPRTTTA